MMTNDMIGQLEKFLREGTPNLVIRQAMNISDKTIRYWEDRFEKEGRQFPKRRLGRPPMIIPKAE